MPFTAQELSNIANSVIDFHLRGKVESQVLQDRPLFNDLMANTKKFGGGKEFITGRVKGLYSTAVQGFSHDDEQAYVNPANIKQWQAKWYEVSAGISVTLTELKVAGVSVVDSMNSAAVTNHSDQELYALTNLLDDKFEDLDEGSKRSFADMLWRDGSQDSKAVPGVRSFILTSPAAGVTFGVDRAANAWWRNRANVGIDSSNAANQNLVNTLQREFRQLRRYATPKHKFYAGSDFMDAFEKELRNKGNYTLEGWAKSGTIDASVSDIAFKGIKVQYEPLLDDLGLSKYGYILDMNAIKLMPMEGEEWKLHTPARPAERYVMYRALTWTGALVTNRLNTSGVYAILQSTVQPLHLYSEAAFLNQLGGSHESL